MKRRKKKVQTSKQIECLHCHKIFGAQGRSRHLATHQVWRGKVGKDFCYLVQEPTHPQMSEVPKLKKRPVVGIDSQFLEIPVILRIPLTMGPIQFVQE